MSDVSHGTHRVRRVRRDTPYQTTHHIQRTSSDTGCLRTGPPRPRLDPDSLDLGPRWARAGPKLDQSWVKAGPKLDQSWAKAGPELGPSWAKVRPEPGLGWSKPCPSQAESTRGPGPEPISPHQLTGTSRGVPLTDPPRRAPITVFDLSPPRIIAAHRSGHSRLTDDTRVRYMLFTRPDDYDSDGYKQQRRRRRRRPHAGSRPPAARIATSLMHAGARGCTECDTVDR